LTSRPNSTIVCWFISFVINHKNLPGKSTLGILVTSSQLTSGVEGRGASAPKSFDLLKIRAKFLKFGQKWRPTLFDFKKMAPNVCRKTNEGFSRGHTKKGIQYMIFVGENL